MPAMLALLGLTGLFTAETLMGSMMSINVQPQKIISAGAYQTTTDNTSGYVSIWGSPPAILKFNLTTLAIKDYWVGDNTDNLISTLLCYGDKLYGCIFTSINNRAKVVEIDTATMVHTRYWLGSWTGQFWAGDMIRVVDKLLVSLLTSPYQLVEIDIPTMTTTRSLIGK